MTSSARMVVRHWGVVLSGRIQGRRPQSLVVQEEVAHHKRAVDAPPHLHSLSLNHEANSSRQDAHLLIHQDVRPARILRCIPSPTVS